MLFPYRSPLDAAKALKFLIEDKVVCDLGCGDGDMLQAFVDNGAKDAVGIERSLELVHRTRAKGFDCVYGNMLDEPLPIADIYYIWVEAQRVFDTFVNIWNKTQKAVFVIADYDIRSQDVERLGGVVITVPYLEDETRQIKGTTFEKEGTWNMTIITKGYENDYEEKFQDSDNDSDRD